MRSFGALGNGTNLDSPAINQAIEACAKAGGRHSARARRHLSEREHSLKSHIHLWIDAGATILGAPQELNAYDPAEPFQGKAYQDGGHTYFHNSLIWGEDLTNVSITGPGMINGGGLRETNSGSLPVTLAVRRPVRNNSIRSATSPLRSSSAATCCSATSPLLTAAGSRCSSPAATT